MSLATQYVVKTDHPDCAYARGVALRTYDKKAAYGRRRRLRSKGHTAKVVVLTANR